MLYIHQAPDWPKLTWDAARLTPVLAETHLRRGRLLGRLQSLGLGSQEGAALTALTSDVVTSSAIEGERLREDDVRSSIARRLGIEAGGLPARERDVEGVVAMALDATRNHEPLTQERLFAWHAALFPTGRSGLHPILVGRWRDDRHGPMRVVSGRVGKERVHFEAPAAGDVPDEMTRFLAWLDGSRQDDALLRSGLAHLLFVTIHPFDDGNGRIARAVADHCLAQSEASEFRFYSVSAEILARRKAYYDMLETTQKGGLDVTDWLLWYVACVDGALATSEATLAAVERRAHFWDRWRDHDFNARQRKVLARLLDDFRGALTTSKWAAIAKCSQDTAARDIAALVETGVLTRGPGGGRSTNYVVAP